MRTVAAKSTRSTVKPAPSGAAAGRDEPTCTAVSCGTSSRLSRSSPRIEPTISFADAGSSSRCLKTASYMGLAMRMGVEIEEDECSARAAGGLVE